MQIEHPNSSYVAWKPHPRPRGARNARQIAIGLTERACVPTCSAGWECGIFGIRASSPWPQRRRSLERRPTHADFALSCRRRVRTESASRQLRKLGPGQKADVRCALEVAALGFRCAARRGIRVQAAPTRPRRHRPLCRDIARCSRVSGVPAAAGTPVGSPSSCRRARPSCAAAVGPVRRWLQVDHRDPPVDQPGVLTRADVTAGLAAARKQPVVVPSSAPL